MSTHLRDDNECQNCGYTVDVAYCSKCGQKNTETRQPFHHLFTHFIEDLVHYDGAFWKTIKHLLFRPARLTKEYLIGKRQTYVAPVKLYIFISFVTFFLMSLILTQEFEDEPEEITQSETADIKSENGVMWNDEYYASVEDFKKKEASKLEEERHGFIESYAIKKILVANNSNITGRQYANNLFSILPKVLFLYMPLFAFWLWLLHGKKRWYFFDHGIFTLHYFSFLLLLFTIFLLITYAISYIFTEETAVDILIVFVPLFSIYPIFYFFRSHSRMYRENRWISRLKSLVLFFINIFLISLAIMAAFIMAL